jgi:tRNA(Arg) A34 adenosine deaminase TadA
MDTILPGVDMANYILKFPEKHTCNCFFFEYNTLNLISSQSSCHIEQKFKCNFDISINSRYKWKSNKALIAHSEQMSLKDIIDQKCLNLEYDLYVPRAICYVCWNFIKYLKIKRIFYMIPYELNFTYYESEDNYKNIDIIQITNILPKHKKYEKPDNCQREHKINVLFKLKNNKEYTYETYSIIESFIDMCIKNNCITSDFKEIITENNLLNIEKLFLNIIM